MDEYKRLKLKQFNEAKKIALGVEKGCMKRAKFWGHPVNFSGFKSNDGRSFVIGESIADIQNPDCKINGFPAREIFDDFSIMEI